jgi:outer membrane lipoprotein carrier protein
LKISLFKIIAGAVLFTCIAGLAYSPASASSDLDTKIEKIQKAYEKIKDMKGSFTQKNTITDLNKTDTYKGEFFIKQPLRMKWVYTGKSAQDIYISDDTVLIYKKGDKQAYRGRFDKSTYGQTPVALLGGFGNIRQKFNISGTGSKLLLIPKNPLGSVTSITVILSNGQFPIKSFTIQDGRSNIVEIVLDDVKINTGLKDSFFKFSLPADVNVYEYNP